MLTQRFSGPSGSKIMQDSKREGLHRKVSQKVVSVSALESLCASMAGQQFHDISHFSMAVLGYVPFL